MFSKACKYAIKATIYIAVNSYDNKRVSPREIAKEINSPEAFTAKILQALVRNNIVNSTKGAHGGFDIDKANIKNIKLIQIVKAIDGDNLFMGCGLGLDNCSEDHPCPVHHKFKVVRDELKYMVENTTLEELASNVLSGETYLKI
ncbi:MAG: RrF2 family transcriptional regulator [Flavobacteriaceae bacterium]